MLLVLVLRVFLLFPLRSFLDRIRLLILTTSDHRTAQAATHRERGEGEGRDGPTKPRTHNRLRDSLGFSLFAACFLVSRLLCFPGRVAEQPPPEKDQIGLGERLKRRGQRVGWG